MFSRTYLRLVLLLALLITIAWTHDNHRTGCPRTQSLELGSQGYIRCNFQKGFYALYWFDDESVESKYIVKYNPSLKEVSGPGFYSERYQVFENGTLLIRNVTTSNERNYTVILYSSSTVFNTFIVTVVVLCPPKNMSNLIDGCEDDNCLVPFDGSKTFMCQSDGARPPVNLSWSLQFPGDIYKFKNDRHAVIRNRNGTFLSLSQIHVSKRQNRLVALFMCTAEWHFSGILTEKTANLLLEFSSNLPLHDSNINTIFFEINSEIILPCGESGSTFNIWKRIQPNGETETLGFRVNNEVKTTVRSNMKIKITSSGSLKFHSLGLSQNGTYVCIYSDGANERLNLTNVIVFVPPSPRFLQVKECSGIQDCVLPKNVGVLTCMAYGVHPVVSIEWITYDNVSVQLCNRTTVINTSGVYFNVEHSVQYTIPDNISCKEPIFLQCNIHGAVERVMLPYTRVKLTPESCEEYGTRVEITNFPKRMYTLLSSIWLCCLTFYVCCTRRGSGIKLCGRPRKQSNNEQMESTKEKKSPRHLGNRAIS